MQFTPPRSAPPAAKPTPSPRQPTVLSSEPLRLAREAADRGAFDEAQKQLAQVLRDEPDSAIPRYLLGEIAMARGDTAAAVREYRQALFLQRSFIAAELGLGLALVRAGKRAEGNRHLTRALELLQPLPEQALVEGLEQPALVARGLAAQVLREEH